MTSRIEDVALAAGVSTATVSRALRGLPKVSELTRAKVLKAATDLQYVASPTASSLASGKTHVVGVVVPYVTRWYFAYLISGASEVLREHGYHVLLFDVGDEGPHRPLLLDSRMLFKRVDAALILSLALHADERVLLRRLNIPIVTVGVPDSAWPCVRIDDVRTTTLATEHLISLGHTRIGYVGGQVAPAMDFPTPIDRAGGFRATMRRHGLTVSPSDETAADWTSLGGLEAGRKLLCRPDRPSAVVVASDELAYGVLAAARELGLSVPGEVSVTGIDDHPLAVIQGLTTVAQPVIEQGRMATQLLMQAVSGHDLGQEITTVGTQLIVRSTTGPPQP